MAKNGQVKGPKVAPPDTRMLTAEQQQQARILLLEKQVMQARKERLQIEDAMLKLRQENLQLRAKLHNSESELVDARSNEFVRGIGADPEADKVDLAGDKAVIHRGALKA